eukprot:gene5869-32050_t
MSLREIDRAFSNVNGAFTDAVGMLFGAVPQRRARRPASEKVLSSLKEVPLSREDAAAHNDCAVCLAKLEEGQPVLKTQMFIDDCTTGICIRPWLSDSSTCPVCRCDLSAAAAGHNPAGGSPPPAQTFDDSLLELARAMAGFGRSMASAAPVIGQIAQGVVNGMQSQAHQSRTARHSAAGSAGGGGGGAAAPAAAAGGDTRGARGAGADVAATKAAAAAAYAHPYSTTAVPPMYDAQPPPPARAAAPPAAHGNHGGSSGRGGGGSTNGFAVLGQVMTGMMGMLNSTAAAATGTSWAPSRAPQQQPQQPRQPRQPQQPQQPQQPEASAPPPYAATATAKMPLD